LDSTASNILSPRASRPYIPGYGVPDSEEGMLPWEHVTSKLAGAKNYWICTATRDGVPHCTPIWGAYLEGVLYLEGSPRTRRGRDIARNPHVAVHLESGDDVVILEGVAEEVIPDSDLAQQLAAAMGSKYEGYQPEPEQWAEGGLYRITPKVVFAWTQFPTDATRWTFE